MAISVDLIKELREATGVGILDCRQALEDANGDFEKAVDILREKGLAKAAKRADREASEGKLELYTHGDGRVGVMVEVNSETDFVARSEEFRNFAHEIALQIAAAAPLYIRVEDIPEVDLEREVVGPIGHRRPTGGEQHALIAGGLRDGGTAHRGDCQRERQGENEEDTGAVSRMNIDRYRAHGRELLCHLDGACVRESADDGARSQAGFRTPDLRFLSGGYVHENIIG